MKFKKHQCIEVHHQYGVNRYECKSFVEAAQSGNYDTWDYEEFATMADAVDAYGDADEVPAELAELLKHGAAISICEPGLNDQRFVAAADFDAEAAACDWLAHDLNRLIVIDSTEDAEYYAENYTGHEEIAVRRAAREILTEAKEGHIEVVE